MTQFSATTAVYHPRQIRELESYLFKKHRISEKKLMAMAAKAAFSHLKKNYTVARICMVCGTGNNAGDAYYLAALAAAAGFFVEIYSIGEPQTPTAAWAKKKALEKKVSILPFELNQRVEADLIVDALFGIGLNRPLEGIATLAIQWMNTQKIPIFSLDVPSGICAATGCCFGEAVYAHTTLTFLGHKTGLLTGGALEHLGILSLDTLGLPDAAYAFLTPQAVTLSYDLLQTVMKPRLRNTHKGDCGHVVILGGDIGMGGAVALAGQAALRAGAGRVSIVTRALHVPGILSIAPTLMVYPEEQATWSHLLETADIIVVGPGLGRVNWGETLYEKAIGAKKPLLLDADAFYFLQQEKVLPDPHLPLILTPHPGEAGCLLSMSTAFIQRDRYRALSTLVAKYPQAACLLKGAGSLLLDEGGMYGICRAGNPALATAGSGDILTGIVAGLFAEHREPYFALSFATLVHAMAADYCALRQGERGLLATDLLAYVPMLINAKFEDFNAIPEVLQNAMFQRKDFFPIIK